MNRLSTRKAGLVVCLGLMAAAILLMALPLGVPLTFAPGPDIRTRKTFAFFDFSVWGMSGRSRLPYIRCRHENNNIFHSR